MLTFHKNLFAISILVMVAFTANAQQVLSEYVKLGLENNQQLIREELDLQIQQQALNEARGKYLPNLFLDASYIRADGGRLISVPAGDLVNPAYGGLNQLFGSEVFPTDIENTEEQFLPNDFHETKLRLIQPILNTDIIFNRRVQQSQVLAKEAKKKAFEDQLVKEIKVAYYRHLSAMDQVAILQNTRTLLLDILRVSQKQVENNKATREVIFGAQAELSELESQIATAEKQEKVSAIFFNYMIGRSLQEPIQREEKDSSDDNGMSDLAELTTTALDQRQELNQLIYGLEASKAGTQLNRNYLVPEINLVGDLGYQGFGYSFDDTQDFWFLRFGLTWPIFQGNQNRTKIQQSFLQEEVLKSQLRETQDLIAVQVAESYYAYQEALKNNQARKAVLESAQENFRIIDTKYRQGLVLQVTMNDARNTYTTAQLQAVISNYEVKMKLAALDAAVAYQTY